MFIEIKDLLQSADISRLRDIAQKIQFLDGRTSNAGNSGKLNQQASPTDALFKESADLMSAALQRSALFQDFAFPRRIAPPTLARYGSGMKYAPHADAAFVRTAVGPIRSDLSCTIFLSEPGD